MSSGVITRKDIITDEALKWGDLYVKDVNAAIEANKKFVESIKQFGVLLQSTQNVSGQAQYVKLKQQQQQYTEQVVVALKLQQSTEASLIKTIEQKKIATESTARALAKHRFELNEYNKRARQAAVISSALSTEYQKQSVRLIQLRDRYKDIALRYGENSKAARTLQKEIKILDDRLKRVDANAGQFQRNVGNYPKGMLAAANAAKQFAGALGLTSGIVLFAQVMREAFNTIKEYNSQLLNVSKTTGITGKELQDLSKDVIELSRTLKTVSSKSLLEYATVAGQLGVKGTENILNFAEALAKLETASDITGEEGGAQIARLLTLVDGGVENVAAFGDELVKLGNNFAATESEILENATAIAQNTGQYNIGRQSALAYGVATKAVGIESEITGSTIGKTLAILEKAIRTGENLEEISKLTGIAQKDLGNAFKENASGVFNQFIKGLNDVNKSGQSLNAQMEKIGITAIRDQRVIGTLATAGYGTLEQALIDVTKAYGSMDEEFETASGKLENQLARFGNTWDNFILSIEDGQGSLGRLIKDMADAFEEDFSRIQIYLNDNISTLDKWKIAVNTYGNRFTFGLIKPFEETTKILIANTKAANDNTKALQDQNQEFINQHGSLGPLTEELKKLNDENERYYYLTQDPSNNIDEINKNTKVTVADLRKEISDLNQAIEDSDKTDKSGIKTKQDKIKALQKELDALLGVNKATKDATKQAEALYRAQLELMKIRATDYLERFQEAADNEALSYEKRQYAIEQAYQTELNLAFLNAKGKFDFAKKFTDDEIKLLVNRGQISAKTLKKVTDEERVIIEQYQRDIAKILKKRDESLVDLTVDQIKTNAKLQEQAVEQSLSRELKLENELFLAKQGIYANELKAVENLEKEKNKIRLRYAKEMLKQQIEGINQLLLNDLKLNESSRLSAEKRGEYETQLSELKQQLSDLDIEIEIEQMDAYFKFLENSNKKIIELAYQAADALIGLTNAVFDARINNIDMELQKLDEYYQRVFDNEQISAENREALEEEYEKKKEALEQKRREEQKKQAVFNKAIAIADVGINLAQSLSQIGASIAAAMASAMAASPLTFGQPWAGIIAAQGGVMKALAIGTALAQIAQIAATPIPAYFKGTDDHKGGMALVGEIRPEVIQEPNKDPYIISKPTILDLPKHTVVTPSVDEYNAMMRASILASVNLEKDNVNSVLATAVFDIHSGQLLDEMRMTRKAIERQKMSVNVKENKIDINHAVYSALKRKWNG